MASKPKKKPKDDAIPNSAELPGMPGALPKKYKALDTMCENLISAQASVSKAQTKRTEIHAILDKGMQERDLKSYFHEDSGKEFIASTKRKVTFKNRKKDDASSAESNAINPGGPVDEIELDDEDDTKEE